MRSFRYAVLLNSVVLLALILGGSSPLVKAGVGDRADAASALTAIHVAAEEVQRQCADRPDGVLLAGELELAGLLRLRKWEPDSATMLERVYRRLRDGSAGREQPALRQLRQAVAAGIRLLHQPSASEATAEHQRQRLALQAAREMLRRQGDSPAVSRQLRTAYSALARHKWAPELLDAVRAECSQPNLHIVVGAGVFERLFSQEISEPLLIDETVEGTRVTGSGLLNGSLTFGLLPNTESGQIMARFQGQGQADSTAQRGRASVFIDSRMTINAGGTLQITEEGLSQGPPSVAVEARSEPRSADFRARGPLLRRLGAALALAVARAQRSRADALSQTRTETEVSQRLQTLVGNALQKLNELYLEQFRLPFVRWDLDCPIAIRSDAAALHAVATLGGNVHLGASGLPRRSAPDRFALYAAMHESAVNNLQVMLAGRDIREDEFQDVLFGSLGLATATELPPPDIEPAMIRLGEEEPFQITLDAGEAQLRLRISAFRLAGKEYSGAGWTAATRYRPRLTVEGLELFRSRPLEIQPAGNPEAEQLRRALERFLLAKARSQGMSGTGEFVNLLQLRLERLEIAEGWLTVSMNPVATGAADQVAIDEAVRVNKETP